MSFDWFHEYFISIHASHAGCDLWWIIPSLIASISIHASHAGCDSPHARSCPLLRHFNPRIPCGMRPCCQRLGCRRVDFNPRIPCGMRRKCLQVAALSSISIHASHAGCDLYNLIFGKLYLYFNPRIPCGMRRKTYSAMADVQCISIHASHAGCDVPCRPPQYG